MELFLAATPGLPELMVKFADYKKLVLETMTMASIDAADQEVRLGGAVVSPPVDGAEAIQRFLPPPKSVQFWLNLTGEKAKAWRTDWKVLAYEASNWLVDVLVCAHMAPEIKTACRSLLMVEAFVINMDALGVWEHIMIPRMQARFERLCMEEEDKKPLAQLRKEMFEIETVLAAKFDVAAYIKLWAEEEA